MTRREQLQRWMQGGLSMPTAQSRALVVAELKALRGVFDAVIATLDDNTPLEVLNALSQYQWKWNYAHLPGMTPKEVSND